MLWLNIFFTISNVIEMMKIVMVKWDKQIIIIGQFSEKKKIMIG